MLQKAPLRKSAPGPPTMSASYVSWTARATWTACLQILPRKTTLERPKVVRTWCVLTILTSRCASPHNRVHFLDISTSKSGLRLSVFNTFVVEMCNSAHFFNISTHKGAPNLQCFSINLLTSKCASRHSRVHYFNFSPRSGLNILTSKCALRHSRMRCLKFWLGSVLRATTACIFWTSHLSSVLRAWGVLAFWLQHVLRTTAACAFWAAQFQKYPKHAVFWAFEFEICFAPQRRAFISVSKSAPKRKIKKIDFKRCFAQQRRAIFDLSYDQMAPQLLFDPPEPQNNGKNTMFRDCSTYLSAHLDVLSTDSLSSDSFSSLFLWLFSPQVGLLSFLWLQISMHLLHARGFDPAVARLDRYPLELDRHFCLGSGSSPTRLDGKYIYILYTIEQNDTTHHSPTHPPKKMCFLRGSDLA